MTNPDSVPVPKVLRGRESVSDWNAIQIQRELIKRNTPVEILSRIKNLDFDSPDNAEGDPVGDALFLRFIKMYVSDYNGFTEFCEAKADDHDLMSRLQENTLKDEDYKELYDFIVVNHPKQLPFFKNETEVDEFLETVLEIEEA